MIIKRLVCEPGKSPYLVDVEVPDDFYEYAAPELEPTTDEILNAMLGVTGDE